MSSSLTAAIRRRRESEQSSASSLPGASSAVTETKLRRILIKDIDMGCPAAEVFIQALAVEFPPTPIKTATRVFAEAVLVDESGSIALTAWNLVDATVLLDKCASRFIKLSRFRVQINTDSEVSQNQFKALTGHECKLAMTRDTLVRKAPTVEATIPIVNSPPLLGLDCSPFFTVRGVLACDVPHKDPRPGAIESRGTECVTIGFPETSALIPVLFINERAQKLNVPKINRYHPIEISAVRWDYSTAPGSELALVASCESKVVVEGLEEEGRKEWVKTVLMALDETTLLDSCGPLLREAPLGEEEDILAKTFVDE